MFEFWVLVASAIVLFFIPIIRVPFTIIEVLMHELSHGIMAILTFGKIKKISIRFNDSGFCETRGGFSILVLLAGYVGASSFGVFIYYIALAAEMDSFTFLYIMIAFLGIVTLLWVRDIRTLLAMIFIIAVFHLPMSNRFQHLQEYTNLYLKFLGIFICLDSLKAPIDLIDGQDVGDGAELAKRLLLPEGVWILFWVAHGTFCMYNIYHLEKYGTFWLWDNLLG